MPRPETFTFSSCLADDDEYDTKVTYISSRSDESYDECDAWVNGFYESSDNKAWVGLDIEWTPTAVRGQAPNPAATLQLGYHFVSYYENIYKALVVHLLHFNADACERLTDLFEDEDITKVGVGIHGDAKKLKRDHDLDGDECCDLGIYAKEHLDWQRPPGLKALCDHYLGCNLWKPDWKKERWNFDRRPLSQNKIMYAATDAVAGWRIYDCDDFDATDVHSSSDSWWSDSD